MGIISLYSKRKKLAERGDKPEVYQYEKLPIEFRHQVIHIWSASIVDDFLVGLPVNAILNNNHDLLPIVSGNIWDAIYTVISKELGLPPINSAFSRSYTRCSDFLIDQDHSIEDLLDLIELTFRVIDEIIRPALTLLKSRNLSIDISQTPDDAIQELNDRFREHSIGYQFENGQIIRVDSGFIHAEVVKPALYLLNSESFAGAEEEFRNAHESYRHQQYKNAIAEAAKSFESTMKTICDNCEWTYSKTDTAQKLINVILKNELVPEYIQSHLSGLKRVLEAGVPTVRNKTSGHGQGAQPTEVPEYLASYVLHMTASNIVLLVEAYKAKTK